MTPRQYPAIIFRDPGSDYGVTFPDFPGCVSAGATPEDALTEATEALAFHVEGMAEDGEAFPEPTPLIDAKAQAEQEEGFLAVSLIAVEMPSKSQRYNITLPEDLVAKVDFVTNNRSAFIAEALRAMLDGNGQTKTVVHRVVLKKAASKKKKAAGRNKAVAATIAHGTQSRTVHG